MNNELKQIKKIYGEKMMHLCRELFPSLLEQDGLLLETLKTHIAPTHSLAIDIINENLKEDFKEWIYGIIDEKEEEELPDTGKTPFELMKEAGYKLYECKTEEDIQRFKHYYRRDEELCTFRGGRLNNCHVFFAVKENVDEIKRENFSNPKRQDEYGTSVISIQFSRGEINTLSIKNRYNHTVMNPDATFSNNLENIIPGLTKSFEKTYNYKIGQQDNNNESIFTYLPYYEADNGLLYRFNSETDGVFFCENNIIIKYGNVIDTYAKNKERYLLIDDIMVDFKEKKLQYLIYPLPVHLGIEEPIESIEVVKIKDNRYIYIYYPEGKSITLEINKSNSLIGIENQYAEEIESNFLCGNNNLEYAILPNVKTIGNNFMSCDNFLESIDLPNVESIGSRFLNYNSKINCINIPKVRTIGDQFMTSNQKLTTIDLPNVESIGSLFLNVNFSLSYINIPKVKTVGYGFLEFNKYLERIDMPEVTNVGYCFLRTNINISSINLPKLRTVGNNFMEENEGLTTLDLPCLKTAGYDFLFNNRSINNVNLPSLETVGDSFLYCSQISKISLPHLKRFGKWFLGHNQCIKEIEVADDFSSLDFFRPFQSNTVYNIVSKRKEKENRSSK